MPVTTTVTTTIAAAVSATVATAVSAASGTTARWSATKAYESGQGNEGVHESECE